MSAAAIALSNTMAATKLRVKPNAIVSTPEHPYRI